MRQTSDGVTPQHRVRRSAPLPRVAVPERDTEYSVYLRIDELLELQRPITPAAHDELLFIVVHQTYELWFKLVLHELRAARDALLHREPQRALRPLQRVVAVEELLLQQVHVLETMSPEGFLEFRDPLAPASGFQSTQYRDIERVSGLGGGEATLWDAACGAMRAAGLDMPGGDGDDARARRLGALADLYLNHAESAERTVLHQLCELLLDHDESVARWRHDHMLMAAREIGARTGTGGTQGVAYLGRTLGQRFYPELWEVRTRL